MNQTFVKPRWAGAWPIILLLAASTILKARHLGHSAVTHWDESFHARVAKNLLQHPFTPTLIDHPYLPYGVPDWTGNHIWLHKPILPLWGIALSFKLLGTSTLALRIPSLVLSAVSVWLTYLIGLELIGFLPSVIAAALQAFNTAIFLQVHGYLFGDHVDTALLVWTEAGFYFLARAITRNERRMILLAGAAQGMAFLCKSYLALIVFAVTLCIFALQRLRRPTDGSRRLTYIDLLLLMAATILVAAPWEIYCAIRFPAEFQYENLQALRHLTQPLEGYGGPWYRVAYDYLLFLYGPCYVYALTAIAAALVWGNSRIRLVTTWAGLVIGLQIVAQTKTPAATIQAIPAVLLLIGWMLAAAIGGRAWAAGMVVGALVMSFVAVSPTGTDLFTPSESDLYAMHWLFWNLLGIVFISLLALQRNFRAILCTLSPIAASAAILLLVARNCIAAYAVTAINAKAGNFIATGELIDQTLPANAVILVDSRSGIEGNCLAFKTTRTCYNIWYQRKDPARPSRYGEMIRQVGGQPFILSARALPFPVVETCPKDKTTVYACPQTDWRLAAR